jgi:hypothetical protein
LGNTEVDDGEVGYTAKWHRGGEVEWGTKEILMSEKGSNDKDK